MHAVLARLCVFWLRSTIRNVTIVVTVLIIGCLVAAVLAGDSLPEQSSPTGKTTANMIGKGREPPTENAGRPALALNLMQGRVLDQFRTQ
jgi:hypothetical protein